MGSMLAKGYVVFALAALPAALAWSVVALRGFKETGSHSAGAGPFAILVLGVIAAFAVNALIGGVVAFFAPSTRPSWTTYGAAVLALSLAACGGWLGLRFLGR